MKINDRVSNGIHTTYQRRKAKGICTGCGDAPARPNRITWQSCATKFGQLDKVLRASKRRRGLCAICAAKSERRLCDVCQQRAYESKERWLARQANRATS